VVAVLGVDEDAVRQRLDPVDETVHPELGRLGRPVGEAQLDDLTRRVTADQLERRALGDDLPVVHHDEPVAELLGLVHVMRRQDQ